MTPLSPNKSDIDQFIHLITRDYRADEWFEIRMIPPEKGRPIRRCFRVAAIPAAVDYITKHNISGLNAYVIANPMATDPCHFATDEDIGAALYQFIDDDAKIDLETLAARITASGITPSFATRTGTQPTERYHLWFRLADRCTDLAAFVDMQKRMAARLGTDPDIFNPSRLMRIAGSVSYPPPKKRALGYETELTELIVLHGQTVRRDDLERAFPALPEVTQTDPAPSPISYGPIPLAVIEAALQAIPPMAGQGMHRYHIEIACACKCANTGSEYIFRTWQRQSPAYTRSAHDRVWSSSPRPSLTSYLGLFRHAKKANPDWWKANPECETWWRQQARAKDNEGLSPLQILRKDMLWMVGGEEIPMSTDVAAITAAAKEWLTDHELHFVSTMNEYFVQDSRGEWVSIKPSAMSRTYPEWTMETFTVIVTQIMQQRGWIHHAATYSFRDDLPTDCFNLMVEGNWVRPDFDSQHHWLFDVLIQSLGANKPENIEHIERVITYKHRVPSAYTLPCLFMFGQGGVGKNLLVDSVLRTIFDDKTLVADSEHVIGSFNSLLAARVVVMIDENREDSNQDKLKALVGSRRVVINPKNKAPYESDNTPLYVVSSQTPTLWLDRCSSDRRWSILETEKPDSEHDGKNTLNYWIAVHEGWIAPDAKGQDLTIGCEKAKQWMITDGINIMESRDECAKWLGHLYTIHGMKPLPSGLHGSDYLALMDLQQPTDELFVEAVFMDEKFTHIGRTTLYRGYAMVTKQLGRKPKGAGVFNKRVETWLKSHKPNVTGAQKRQNIRCNRIWMDVMFESEAGDLNDDRYLDERGNWKGPSI